MKKYFCAVPLVILFCFTIACQDKAAMAELEKYKAQAKVEEQNIEVVKRYWNGKWNERRPGILGELQTQDILYHGTSMEMNGLEWELSDVYQQPAEYETECCGIFVTETIKGEAICPCCDKPSRVTDIYPERIRIEL